jgi:hypothetical protein
MSRRIVAGSTTWAMPSRLGQPTHPHQQRAIAAPQRQTCWSLSQSDIELMTEKEDLGFKPPSRLEQTDDKHCEQAEDREHRMR